MVTFLDTMSQCAKDTVAVMIVDAKDRVPFNEMIDATNSYYSKLYLANTEFWRDIAMNKFVKDYFK